MSRSAILRRLRADHRRVIASLDALERDVPALRPADARGRARHAPLRTARLAKVVAHLERQFATHMTAEDESLFPSLAAALPQSSAGLEPLRDEHVELRAILASLAALLAGEASPRRDEQIVVQWRDFAALLRIHIRKEEALVFRVAERALGPGELERVADLRYPRRGPVSGPGSSPRKVAHR